MGLPVTDKNGIKGKPVHVALKSSPKDHHRPQFCHSLSIRIYLRRKITVPVRRFPAGIIKDILQRSIRSVFVQGYCYKLVILAASILSLSLSVVIIILSVNGHDSPDAPCRPLTRLDRVYPWQQSSRYLYTCRLNTLFDRPFRPFREVCKLVLASFDLADPSP